MNLKNGQTMENKQTAVEWIVLQFGFQGRNNQEMLYVKQIVEQAKAMHKEQISNGYFQGLIDGMNNSPKEYYKETYEQ